MTDNGNTTAVAGDLLAEYEVLGELGRGGSAVVYLARDRELGRKVAIKVVRARLAGDEEALARLAREARTVARLDHPHIVAVHAVRRLGDGSLALVMGYVPGRTLKQAILQEAPFTAERTEAVLRDIASALAYAHRQGVVHRDVKPENIFLHEGSERAMLADFGTARSLDGDTRVTMEGAAIGTPTYMSPEQIDGAAVDGRSDLYSLALVGWEMLTGEAPWEGETLYNVILKQKSERLPPLKRLRPDVPARLWYALELALRKNRDERPASAEALLDEIDDAGLAARWRRIRAGFLLPRATAARREASAPAPESSQTVRYVRPAADEVPVAAPPRRRRWAAQRRTAAAAFLLLGGSAAVVSALSLRSAGAEEEPVPARDRPAAPLADRSPAPDSAATLAASSPAESVPGFHPFVLADTPLVAPSPAAPVPAPAASAAAPSATSGDPAPARQAAAASASASSGAGGARTTLAVVTGGTHSCALERDGTALCWGGNERGQLGAGTSRASQPRRIDWLRFVSLSAGVSHTCGIARSGEAFCWGANDSGQLGGSADGRAIPVRVDTDEPFSRLAAGMAHSCGLLRSGRVLCWGANDQGQLGDGERASRATPAPISAGSFRALAVGWNHGCGVNGDGKIFCWGDNSYGQLGRGARVSGRTPEPVLGSQWFVSATAGSAHTCALTGVGDAFCWGRNSYGQLGDGGQADRDRPRRVAGDRAFASITAGGVHTCALTGAGEAFCWGRNSYGQLGDGSTTNRSVPTRVQGGHRFAQIEASGAHTCGVTRGGENLCWGYNVEGQLGDGSRRHRTAPVQVERSE